MYTLTLLYILFLIHNNPNNIQNVSDQIASLHNKNINNNDGKDMRNYDFQDNNLNKILLYKVQKNLLIKNLLEELEKNNTDIYCKLELLEKYSYLYNNKSCVTGFDLFAGDLWNNF